MALHIAYLVAIVAVASVIVRLRRLFLLLDALGLVVFAVIGCNVADSMSLPLAIVLVSGLITGTCGGVLRDLLCGQPPLLFRKDPYASVALLTGLLYMGGQKIGLHHDLAMVVAMAAGFALRVLAIRYDRNMPRFVYRGAWN